MQLVGSWLVVRNQRHAKHSRQLTACLEMLDGDGYKWAALSQQSMPLSNELADIVPPWNAVIAW